MLDILKPALVVGGEADWNAPNRLPADFVPEGFSDEPLTPPVARYWKAMTSGGSTGRPKVILDHQPAVTDTAAAPPLSIPVGVVAAQSRAALSQCAVHRVALRAVHRRPAHRPHQVRRRGDAAPDRARARAMGQFRADHDAPDLGAAGGRAQALRCVEPADRVSHGRADAALAEGELDRLARAGADLGALWRHRAAGRLHHLRHGVAGAQGLGRQDRRHRKAAHRRRGRQRRCDGRDRRDLFPQQ